MDDYTFFDDYASDVDEYRFLEKRKELEAARNLIWMWRGMGVPEKDLIKLTTANQQMIELCRFHVFKLTKNFALGHHHCSEAIEQLFDELELRSKIQQTFYTANVLDQRPILMDYNPNKTNTIKYRNFCSLRDQQIRIDKRRRNNEASRLSRLRKKERCRITEIETEFLEQSNELLVKEINDMSAEIRMLQMELAQRVSPGCVFKLRDMCGLKAISI